MAPSLFKRIVGTPPREAADRAPPPAPPGEPSTEPGGDDILTIGYRCWRVQSPLFRHDNFNRCERDFFAGGSVAAVIGFPEERDEGFASGGAVEIP